MTTTVTSREPAAYINESLNADWRASVPRIISLRREFRRGNVWEKSGLWNGSQRVDVTR